MKMEGVMSIPFERACMEPSRYRLLFTFENIYGILRCGNENRVSMTSTDYGLLFIQPHNCPTPYDVLKDILFLYRSAGIKICRNDVICIHINGCVWNYRFLGLKDGKVENFMENFMEVKKFLDGEKNCFIEAIHGDNKVLSVLDGRIYNIQDVFHKYYCLYAIENEHFFEERNGHIFSDCSLYLFDGKTVRQKNFYGKPFCTMKNALYYFCKERKKKGDAILLLNREELEMIADYNLLDMLVV